MRERPDPRDLVVAVRNVLKAKILPAVDPSLKMDVLMALNALSIAERQIVAGDAPLDAERAALGDLLGAPVTDLAAGSRALSARLRRGDGDPGQPDRAALFAHLRATGRARLAESNPRLLAPAGAGTGAKKAP